MLRNRHLFCNSRYRPDGSYVNDAGLPSAFLKNGSLRLYPEVQVMDFPLKLTNFVFKMTDLVFKMTDFVSLMMKFAAPADDPGAAGGG